jgi:hypothetical protein
LVAAGNSSSLRGTNYSSTLADRQTVAGALAGLQLPRCSSRWCWCWGRVLLLLLLLLLRWWRLLLLLLRLRRLDLV